MCRGRTAGRHAAEPDPPPSARPARRCCPPSPEHAWVPLSRVGHVRTAAGTQTFLRETSMALNNPTNLFLYELASMYDAEKKSGQLLSDTAGQVQDGNLAQLLRGQEQESQQKVNNLEACFRALGIQPQAVPCAAIDGMRSEFETFANQQPSPDVWQMYTLGAAL